MGIENIADVITNFSEVPDIVRVHRVGRRIVNGRTDALDGSTVLALAVINVRGTRAAGRCRRLEDDWTRRLDTVRRRLFE